MKAVNIRVAIALASLAAMAAPAVAGDSCCRCGGGCGVRKVCRLECKPETIKDNCYGCECDTICIPGCYKRGCLHCEGCCGEVEGCCGWRPCCCLEWFDWCPTCATPKCVKKLVKYEISRDVPRHKWVVEDVCAGCCQDCDHPCDAEGGPAPEAGLDVPGPGQDAPPAPPIPPQARSPRQGWRLSSLFQK